MLHVDVWCLCVHRVRCLHVKGSETFDCDRISSMHIQLFLSHSGCFGCSPGYQLWCRVETRKDIYWGHMWPGLVPGEHGSTTLILSVRQPVSQPVSGKGLEWEWRHAARKGAWLNGSKTSIPSSQSQSTETLNDAGSLQRPAGWNWVKEDPMSH